MNERAGKCSASVWLAGYLVKKKIPCAQLEGGAADCERQKDAVSQCGLQGN